MPLDAQLLRVLRADNPWLQGEPYNAHVQRFLPADYLPRTLRLVAGERIMLVVGPRQSGKSTLIWKTLEKTGEPALYLDCEEPSVRDWLRSPAAFLADLTELAPEVPALFFEEAQCLPEAGLFLKGLADRKTGKRIYVTGSSSFDLQSRTRESLAGRARRHLLLPFSLAEVRATFAGGAAVRAQQLAERIEQLVVFGAYPQVFTAADPRSELAGLVEAFVVRDASDRFRIRYPAAMRQILQLAASQVGNLCRFTEWAALAGISNDTVREYCRLLEETHVLRLVRPFVGGKRAEITSAPKVFFLDNGIRNQLFGGFQPVTDRADRGALVENLVFSELSKHLNPLLDSIRFWRSKSGAEVDFVVERQGRLAGFEVKAGDARGRLSRSARSFLDAYALPVFFVVNRRRYDDLQLGSTTVRFVRLVDLPDVLQGNGSFGSPQLA